MSNAVKAQGTTLKWNSVTVGEVSKVNPPSESVELVDATHLSSTGQEFISTAFSQLKEATLEVNLLPTDTGQLAMRADMRAGTPRTVVITLPDARVTTCTFTAYCKGFEVKGDKKYSATITLQPTGLPTWS
ncbi:MAG: hypothetical protein HY794_18230 [Desulfarculus sp.]|nr:hypothetical protein [Desulfarculus sp.]